jgi:hypothetical protein
MFDNRPNYGQSITAKALGRCGLKSLSVSFLFDQNTFQVLTEF